MTCFKDALSKLIEDNIVYTPKSAQSLKVGELCNIYGKCQMFLPDTDPILGMSFHIVLQCDGNYPNSDDKNVVYVELDKSNLFYNYVLHDAYTELADTRMMFFGKIVSIKDVKGTIIPVIGDVVLTKILTGRKGGCSDGGDIESI